MVAESYDVVVVGGGLDGLTAAAYTARAGLSTLVLERLPQVGSAAAGVDVFPGSDVRISRYPALVGPLHQQVVDDLGLELDLRSRRTTTDGAEDLHGDLAKVAAALAPTLTEPLRPAKEIAAGIDPDLWQCLVDQPLGLLLEERIADDTVRGAVATDAVAGTFAALDDPTLAQNRCFLHRVVGNGDGGPLLPVGGPSAVADALEAAARGAGAEIVTRAGVSRIVPDADGCEVRWHDGSSERTVRARRVLVNVAPWVLRILLGEPPDPDAKPAGAQLTISALLSRLPRLASGEDPEAAFASSFHVATGYAELQQAYDEAASGAIPSRPPGVLTCDSLPAHGVHTLTWFGLHMPEALFAGDREAARDEAVRRTLATIEEYLEEPLMDCVLRGPDGAPYIEAKVPQDVEAELAMPGGHIFHGDLAWPWASNRESLATPAHRWGVATGHDTVLVCGSGARRGGAVSGLGGHNAAHAVLEELDP